MSKSQRPFVPPSGALRFAEVALDRPLDHNLTYSIPEALAEQLRVGSLVEVPLRSQTARGVVNAINTEAGFRGAVKSVARLLTPEYSINPEVMHLGRWMAGYYRCALGEALAAISFVGLNDVHALMKSHLALSHPDHWLAVSREAGPEGKKVTPKQAQVIHTLLARGNDPLSGVELREEAGVSESVIQTMLERKWLVRVQEPVEREDDYPAETRHEFSLPSLTPAQTAAVETILKSVHDGRHQTFLLHGVTGSGKTEVYLRVISDALRLGKTAIVLVPEIALTPQTVGNFRSRLGPQVGVYHSRLTLGQKFDLWKKIAAGEVRVLIGARSAVFAPMPNLGVIVADEEHETTFKQGETPRYHARDVAVWRMFQRAGVAILGSATPSMESFHNAHEGKYSLLELPERIGPHASPAMTIIDMKRHFLEGLANSGNKTAGDENSPGAKPHLTIAQSALISPTLRAAIEKRLAAKEQTVLLLNRRGFANHVICLKCEKSVECPHCDVSLTFHKYGDFSEAHKKELSEDRRDETGAEFPHFREGRQHRRNGIGRLICHWCGHTEPVPEKCPKCGETEIQALGLGTQKIEEVIAELFPSARTIRIDVDTMRGRRSFIEAWEKISRREVDIILGTQMIAKGFHLESVSLVGVISADFALFIPDFRGAEKTFQLLTQVAGRAGRGDIPGEVIVQSFIPHHYAIEHAARLDEKGFYERELHIRKMLRFPPLFRLIAVLLTGTDLPLLREQSERLANLMKALARRSVFAGTTVLGPAPAPIAKIEDQYRQRILLRGAQHRELHELLSQGLAAFDQHHEKGKIAVQVDVDPIDLL